MAYSLDNFCHDTRTILAQGDDSGAREKIRQKLELLLIDEAFCDAYLGPDNGADNSGVSHIFEDPDLHFCVLTYNMATPRTSPPHDHGTSWAVYGQVAGHTDMTLWQAAGGGTGKIEPVRSFRLQPGQAGLFDKGEIHSITYPAGSKFVRITGAEMSQETRRVFDLETGTVKEVKSVGTGSG